jgi:ABC-type transport system involved in cytochrome c biogenesis permease subunit
MIEYVKARIKERTTWDGSALIAVGVIALLFKGLITWAAWGAILYGAWTIWKKED